MDRFTRKIFARRSNKTITVRRTRCLFILKWKTYKYSVYSVLSVSGCVHTFALWHFHANDVAERSGWRWIKYLEICFDPSNQTQFPCWRTHSHNLSFMFHRLWLVRRTGCTFAIDSPLIFVEYIIIFIFLLILCLRNQNLKVVIREWIDGEVVKVKGKWLRRLCILTMPQEIWTWVVKRN